MCAARLPEPGDHSRFFPWQTPRTSVPTRSGSWTSFPRTQAETTWRTRSTCARRSSLARLMRKRATRSITRRRSPGFEREFVARPDASAPLDGACCRSTRRHRRLHQQNVPVYAEGVVLRIDARLQSARRHLEIGKRVAEQDDPLIRELVSPPYRVFYRPRAVDLVWLPITPPSARDPRSDRGPRRLSSVPTLVTPVLSLPPRHHRPPHEKADRHHHDRERNHGVDRHPANPSARPTTITNHAARYASTSM